MIRINRSLFFIGFRKTHCEFEQESSTWVGDRNGSESREPETGG